MVTPYLYIPPGFPSLYMPIATEILVVNMPPLGCIPALLTLYGGKDMKYDSYGDFFLPSPEFFVELF